MQTEAELAMYQIKKENQRLKRCLAYLASCNAATIDSLPKSTSKGTKKRFVGLVQKSVDMLEGKWEPSSMFGRDEVKNAIERGKEVIAKSGM